MQEQTTSSQWPEKLARPSGFSLFTHVFKTLRLIGALLQDQRVPFIRKALFFGSILFLLILLLFPDVFGEVFLSVVMPLVGTILGVPIDAGFDWIALAIAIISLLRVFPAQLVAEHYQRIFHKR